MFEQYDDILTIEEVAELLRIGMTQAYRIVRSGNLKGSKEGKDWKIPKQALISFIYNIYGLAITVSICKATATSIEGTKRHSCSS